MISFLRRSLCAAVAVVVAGLMLAPAKVSAGEKVDIFTTAYRAGNFSQFVAAAGLTGEDEVLKGEGPLTVFAPSDAAFGKLPADVLFKLLQPENKALLKQIIGYHIVRGDYPAERLLKARAKVFTIPGESGTLEIDIRGETIKAEDATVKDADVAASNGTIHVINKVLIPFSVARMLEKL